MLVVAVATPGSFDVFDGSVRGFGASVRDAGGDGDLDSGPPGGDGGREPVGLVGSSSGHLSVELDLRDTGSLDGGAGPDQSDGFLRHPRRRPVHRSGHRRRTRVPGVHDHESTTCRSRVTAACGAPTPDRLCGRGVGGPRGRGVALPGSRTSWTRWNGSTAIFAVGKHPVMAFRRAAGSGGVRWSV